MIIQRYLFKEILGTLFAVTSVLFVIYLSNRLWRFLAEAQAGSMSGDVIAQLVALKSFSNLTVLLPLAVFFAVILAFGRLYKDNEITVLAACGVGTMRLARTVGGLALVCGVVVGALALYGGPWAEDLASHIQERAVADAEVGGIAAGRFKEMRGGRLVFYVEKLSPDRRTLSNVFVQGVREGRDSVLVAERGYFRTDAQGDRYLVLQNGRRYQGQPGSPHFEVVDFQEHGLLIEEPPVISGGYRLAATPTALLWDSNELRSKAELQWRWSMPLATVLLALLAVPLSRARPRQGRYAKLFAAVLVYVIYTNMMVVARSWLERGKVDPLLGVWWVHAVVLVIAVVMLMRDNGWRWQRQALT